MAHAQHLNWDAEALWQALEPLLPGITVEVVARTASTNTTLVERARHSAGGNRATDWVEPATSHGGGRRVADLQPCLLVAETQTHGRGRQGKTWHAEAGASLTFSLSLPLAPADWSGLSLAVGLAVAEALDPLDTPGQRPRLWLKWPNDLLLESDAGARHKLGGILIETVPVGDQRVAVIGIGLNVRAQTIAEPLPWGHADLQGLHPDVGAPEALHRLAPPLARRLRAFERDGFAPLAAAYARRDALAGESVVTTLPQVPQGVADGVDARGMLWLRRGADRVPVGSGEVSLRQAAGTAGDAP
jgi:BirA family biotin operon repressor/biotin-[acetyl-CoA-carboxylase] ligase